MTTKNAENLYSGNRRNLQRRRISAFYPDPVRPRLSGWPVKLNPAKVLDFEQAKAKATQDYEKVLRAQKLQEQAKAELKDFKGTDIAGVTRTSKIAGLSQEESTNFLNQLFFATTKEGVIGIGDKIVL